MISKMINEASCLTKQQRKNFIPFVNQRDHMGMIIKNRPKQKQYLKSIQVFENLKKTTKEYFFDKKFQKMRRKLQRYKNTLEPIEPDYDKQIRKCFKSLQKNNQIKMKTLYGGVNLLNHKNKENVFFIDINQRLNENINQLKEEIDRKKGYNVEMGNSRKMAKTMNNFSRFHTVHMNLKKSKNIKSQSNSFFHHNGFKLQKYNNQNNQNNQSNQTNQDNRNNSSKDNSIHNLGNSQQFQQNQQNHNNTTNEISRQLFKTISLESQKMVDFTNFGLKYRHFVQTKNTDPWKKWYVESTLQIFPGEKLKLKNYRNPFIEMQ